MVPKRSVLEVFRLKHWCWGARFLVPYFARLKRSERLDLAGEWPLFRGNVDWTVNRETQVEPSSLRWRRLMQSMCTRCGPRGSTTPGMHRRDRRLYANPICH